VVGIRVTLPRFRVDSSLLRDEGTIAEIGSAKTPQLPQPETSDKAVAGVPLKGFGVDFHEGRSLLAVQ